MQNKMKILVGMVLVMMVVGPLVVTVGAVPTVGDPFYDDPDDAPTPDDEPDVGVYDGFWGWVKFAEFEEEPFLYLFTSIIMLAIFFGCYFRERRLVMAERKKKKTK
jgi:hypothetical protein